MRKINLLLLLALTTMSWAQQQTLEKGWKFTREDQMSTTFGIRSIELRLLRKQEKLP